MRRLRVPVAVAFLVWGGVGCAASPAMLAPMFMPQPQPLSYAIPTDEGAQYVLVEAKKGTADPQLKRRWEKKADEACKGEFVVLSENQSQRNQGGRMVFKIYEGYVRCVNPEANESLELAERS